MSDFWPIWPKTFEGLLALGFALKILWVFFFKKRSFCNLLVLLCKQTQTWSQFPVLHHEQWITPLLGLRFLLLLFSCQDKPEDADDDDYENSFVQRFKKPIMVRTKANKQTNKQIVEAQTSRAVSKFFSESDCWF